MEQVRGEKVPGRVADSVYAVPVRLVTDRSLPGVLVEVAASVVGVVLEEDLAPAWVGVEVMAEASAGGDLVRPGALVMHQHTAPIL